MRRMDTGLVAVHLAATFWHGNLHSRLSIDLSPRQTLFVIGVIIVAPILAAALVWTRYLSSGLWIFFLSMLGSFLFSVYNHYVMVSPDNIHYLSTASPESNYQFMLSAGVIAWRLDALMSVLPCSWSASTGTTFTKRCNE